MLDETSTVGVVGAGAMGGGIAQVALRAGHEVILADARPGAAERAAEGIARDLAREVEKGRLASRDADAAARRLRPVRGAEDLGVFGDCALVVEAIVEELGAKQDLFAAVEAATGAEAVLASNTSAIDIDAIGASCRDRSRILGTHWFNPPHIVPAVEVVPGRETDAAVVERVVDGLRSIGRVPSITKNAPGFVANRIQFAMIAEAFRCLQDGVADAETIDAIVRTSFGPRLAAFGLFEIADLAGLDVYTAILDLLARELRQPGFEPTAALRALTDAGRLGVKSGSGVFDYEASADAREERDRALYRVFAQNVPAESAT